MSPRRLAAVLRKAGNAWIDDHAQSMGAALSYYTMFSIAPLLLIAISVAGLVFGQDAARGAVVEQLQGLIGPSGAEAVQGLLKNVAKPAEGVVATITGLVVLVIGATSVFAELQDDLNRIWQVPAKEKVAGWWAWLRTRILSIGMILAIGFLMLVSLAASAAFDAFAAWSTSGFAEWEPLAHGVNFALSFVFTTVLFAMIYRFMPQATIEWRDVGIGAVVTAFLFAIGKYLIGLYIGKSALASGFGAAGSLAVLLAWVYYSAQIFLFGAEFTWAYAHAFGSRQGAPDGAADAQPQLARASA
jgi:membrane protein